LKQQGRELVGFVDDNKEGEVDGINIIGKTDNLSELDADSFVIGIGMNLKARDLVFKKAIDAGLEPVNVIDEKAIIDKTAKIGKGNIILAGSVIGHFAKIGDNCFIFSNSIIEHNCELGNNVQLAPGASLAGSIKIGDNTLIGIGANIIEEIKIGENSIVGAGAVVLNDVPDNTVVAGVPAKELRKNE